jgi:hypothetical protein
MQKLWRIDFLQILPQKRDNESFSYIFYTKSAMPQAAEGDTSPAPTFLWARGKAFSTDSLGEFFQQMSGHRKAM